MDDLRRELEQSGFSNTTLDLRQGTGQQDHARQQFPGRAPGGGGGGPAAEGRRPVEPAAPRRTADDGRLDIQA
jgi:hypothetical protein